MVHRPLLALALLPLLLASWVACPCIYTQWISNARGADAAAPSTTGCDCCCCGNETRSASGDETEEPRSPARSPAPCERRSARTADMPPIAPALDLFDAPALAVLVDTPTTVCERAIHVAREVLPAPPDVLRRGTVLIR